MNQYDLQYNLNYRCIINSKEINSNCDEINILEWFNNNFVLKEDKEYFYMVSPLIVNSIDSLENSEQIYKFLYNNLIIPFIENIKKGNYLDSYKRYINSITLLEDEFVKPLLYKKLIKILNNNM